MSRWLFFPSAEEEAGLTEESSTKGTFDSTAAHFDTSITIPEGSNRIILAFCAVSQPSSPECSLDPAGDDIALTPVTGSPSTFDAGEENVLCWQLLEADFPASTGSKTLRVTPAPTSTRRGRVRVVVLSGANQTIQSTGGTPIDGGDLTITLTHGADSFDVGSLLYGAAHCEGSADHTITGDFTAVDDEAIGTVNDIFLFGTAGPLVAPDNALSMIVTRVAGGVTRKQAILVGVEPA